MASKLKPCPFCGGEASIVGKRYEANFCVGCDDDSCLWFSGLGWTYDSEQEAAEAWNRRSDRSEGGGRMIPYMSIPMRIIAWLLWRFNGWNDPDECMFECIEHPGLARSASVCMDYWYVRKSKKEGER